MCVGTAATIGIITAGVSAGTSIAGAKIASGASKKASATQSAAADKALIAQQQGYQQQRQDFSPYQQAGAAAVGRLGQTAGTYSGGPPAPQAQRPMMPPQQQGPPMGQLGQPPTQMPPSAANGTPLQGRGPGPQQQQSANAGINFGQMGQAVQQAPGGGPMPGALVKVRAPTGEIATLPREMAERAIQKGATVIQ